eukprot:Gb_05290 [translate_table: standard]
MVLSSYASWVIFLRSSCDFLQILLFLLACSTLSLWQLWWPQCDLSLWFCHLRATGLPDSRTPPLHLGDSVLRRICASTHNCVLFTCANYVLCMTFATSSCCMSGSSSLHKSLRASPDLASVCLTWCSGVLSSQQLFTRLALSCNGTMPRHLISALGLKELAFGPEGVTLDRLKRVGCSMSPQQQRKPLCKLNAKF